MKVSIITPSFNQGRFIERTLQSVANQTGAEIEHVIFDGGSTDNTVEILKRFNPPIRWVSKKDKGQTDAVNQGILATDGEIIGWLNSDDVYYPGAIARIVAFFEANPEVDLVYGMADHIDVEDYPFESYATESWDFERLKEHGFICQPAAFFRRQVIKRYGLLDDSLDYCMDYEYWLRLGKEGANFAFLEEKLAGSRMYPENKTMRAKVHIIREANNMLKKKFGKVPNIRILAYAHAIVVQKNYTNRTLKEFKIVIYLIIYAIKWNKVISLSLLNFLCKSFYRRLNLK